MHPYIAKSLIITMLASTLILSACDHNNKATPSESSSTSSSSGSFNLELNLENIQVHFPPTAVSTQDESITVRGIVEDATDVAQLFINGNAVTSDDNLTTWQANIPLSQGANQLSITQQSSTGEISEVTRLTVTRETPLISPLFMASDTTNNRLLVWDGQLKQLIAVDITSGNKKTLSPNAIGATNLIENPHDIVVDTQRNRVLSYSITQEDPELPYMVATDLTTGEQRKIDLVDDDSLEELNRLTAVIIDESTAYIADKEEFYIDRNKNRVSKETTGASKVAAGVVFQLDLINNKKTVVSAVDKPDKLNPLSTIIDMTTTSESEYIYVLDYSTSTRLGQNVIYYNLFSVNKSTGERLLLTIKNEDNKTIDWANPKAIQLDSTNQLLYLLNNNSIIRVDINTKTHTTLASSVIPVDSSYPLAKAEDIVLSNGALYVVDDSLNYILSVDLTSGVRTPVSTSGSNNPDGKQNIFSASSVTLDAINNQVFVLDTGASLLTSVDLAGSGKSILPISLTETPDTKLQYPVSSVMNQTKGELIIFDNANQRFNSALSAKAPKFFTLNTTTSELSLIQQANNSSIKVHDIVFHEGSQNLFAIEEVYGYIYIRKWDFSGEKPVTSYFSHNSLPNTNYPFREIRSLAIDYSHNRLLVADATQKTITAVSLNNGDRTPFSTAGLPINGGPILQKPTAIVVDEKHNRALVLDSVADAVFSVDLETGVREIIVNNVTDSFNKLYNPTDMDLHPAFNFLVLIDNSSDVLMAVDLETNQKVVLSH